MEPGLNLLLTLHPLAVRQDENFTTAALVNLLRHLSSQHEEAFLAILNLLGGEDCPFASEDTPQLEIKTWAATPHGIPDFRVETRSKLLLVEVKVSAGISKKQVDDYLRELHSYEHKLRRLALLTRYPVQLRLPENVAAVRWYEVAEHLDAYRPLDQIQPASFLTDQFLEFICGQSLMVPQLRSSVSTGLRDYLAAHRDDSVFNKRIRSLTRLSKHDELRPLHDLLLMLDEALQRLGVSPPIRLDSGQSEGGWIGYNIHSMHYFLYLRLARPEVLIFQDYRGPVAKAAVQPGKGYLAITSDKTTWKNEMDLVSEEIGFFQASRSGQLQLLEDFFLNSRSWAEEIETASAADE